MAIQDKFGKIRGRVGNLTYRVVNNKNVLQSRAGRGNTKMNPASLEATGEFGLASNRASIIRRVLDFTLASRYDGKMINRLNAAVFRTIKSNPNLLRGQRDLPDGSLETLEGFEFNMHAPFSEYFLPELGMTASPEGIQVGIPVLEPLKQIQWPAAATEVQLTILVSAIDLAQHRYSYCEQQSLRIPREVAALPGRICLFNQNLPENVLLLCTASLQFFAPGLTEKTSLSSNTLHPVMLLGLFRSENFDLPEAAADPAQVWGKWFPIPTADEKAFKKY